VGPELFDRFRAVAQNDNDANTLVQQTMAAFALNNYDPVVATRAIMTRGLNSSASFLQAEAVVKDVADIFEHNFYNKGLSRGAQGGSKRQRHNNG
jgi:hypothetical protein